MACGSSAFGRTCSRRFDDGLEEEEAGGKGAAHRATAARGQVSGCECDMCCASAHSCCCCEPDALTKFEEMVPKHVPACVSAAAMEMDLGSTRMLAATKAAHAARRRPRPRGSTSTNCRCDAEVGGGESGGEGGDREEGVEDGHGCVAMVSGGLGAAMWLAASSATAGATRSFVWTAKWGTATPFLRLDRRYILRLDRKPERTSFIPSSGKSLGSGEGDIP